MKWLLLSVAIILVPRLAAAQDTFCAQATSCTTAVSSTSGTTIVGIGLTMLSRIRDRRIAALGRYVQMNEVAILGAVTRGGGDVLLDLAELAGVREEELADFVARLRERRSAFAEGHEARYLGALVLHAAEG